ncbi:methyltransferase [Streptomyces mobaraensis NBRC 13819 = DSM 40847]|uniref:rRNA or tRNA methyltransferase n=1 Tax=Streptomyces mobaraensis (strain ATCC 29032 / DSM 40847 / JCM 4168 / NBRC 13819 / NCIMB 11159 / IPCR 16-22) TaxID=1223523 RepID=M3A9Z5_STRM1|nr:methyltransferase [Streptomyces mobaraensis]EMF01974.1 rRNA or tRNA methyltransferase [Streptomyces mobaraensis NBRC 13819 = DSM 40847]QTT74948.1 methyltransferase [Streptomyces mobaraensis NBRC 13819 = DSM 40847]
MSTLPSADAPVPSARTARLRDALLAAAFTADGLLELLGAPAYAALARSETVPALRATRGDGPLETLVRLFLLQRSVPAARAAAALPLEDCLADGWLVRDGDAVRASVDVRPYGGPEGQDWWIVSDLGCAVGGAGGIAGGGAGPAGIDRSELVLGVGGASTTLAGITVRTPVGSALDLGTGSGIQALHAAQHAGRVTATDLNPRALRFARLTLALSGAPEADLRQGSLFEPVAGETYDLIVSNPPFVISPGARLTYRDGGMGGDDLCRTLVSQAADRLNDGGYCQLLANWQHVEGEDWRERLSSWVPAGCDAWIVQREVQDVAQYAELWLRDAGDHRASPEEYAARYDAWLAEFEDRRTKGVGFGWITLRKSGAERPSVIAEEWPHPVEQPLGESIRAHFERQEFLRTHDDAALLEARFRLAPEVVQEQVGLPGAEDPEHVVLRQNRGMRRATKVDTVGAGFAGVCDGTLSAGRILDAIAQLVGEDPVLLRDRTPEAIRLLVEQGFLTPEG